LTRGIDAGGYYHERFLRGKTFLCKQMTRTKVKGTRFKAASSPEQEPDFYTMVRLCWRERNRKVDCIVLESVLTLCIILSSLQNAVAISPSNTSDEEMSNESEQSAETYSLYPQGVPSVYEPLPVQYANTIPGQAAPLPQLSSSYPPMAAMSSFPFVDPMARVTNADRVLDDAVAELFLHEPAESDSLDEFVHDWDPNFNFNFGMVLRDDTQLGFMLEKLMED
jgi:hypothetical protein